MRKISRHNEFIPNAVQQYIGKLRTALGHNFPDDPIPPVAAKIASPYSPTDPPVFFGHYWLKDEAPSRLASNVACLDYSVANRGKLCAYRRDGEQELSDENFLWVERG